MKLRRIVFVFAIAFFAVAGTRFLAQAQQPSVPPNPNTAMDQKIMAEIKDHNEIMGNLEYLSDMIGARLTGTENLTKASHWTEERFKAYGLANVHLEPWSIQHAWFRGTARARIVGPAEHSIIIASAGWAPGTAGTVRGTVMYVKAEKSEDLQQYKGKLKGAIVLTAEPRKLAPIYDAPTNPLLVPFREPYVLRNPNAAGQPPEPAPNPAFSRERYQFFKNEGVAAVLQDSGKEDALLNMTGIGGRNFDIGAVPVAFIASPNYQQIWRLMQRGAVQVEVDMTNTFSDKTVEVYNTVAEIRGSEKPDEVVVLGAHLDSWDLATGSTDNGTGSMVVLETARAMQKLGLKPKRTIRFVLFCGEEEGLCGSRAYVAAHKDELPKISGALVHDTGTGKVISIGMMGNYQDREVMDQVLSPLHEIGLLEPSLRVLTGSDHASFNEAGVPGFFGIQDPADYNRTHHSQSDTFDRAKPDELTEGAQVLAVWAYNVAQLQDLLPRVPGK